MGVPGVYNTHHLVLRKRGSEGSPQISAASSNGLGSVRLTGTNFNCQPPMAHNNPGKAINIGLAVEVVKHCDELCLGWQLVNECRDHLNKVKAQSYIDKYEMKLCEATITCEAALQSVRTLIAVAQDERVKREGGVLAVVTLLDLVVQASSIAQNEGWQCPDLLEAVTRDVVTFSKEMGIESRVAPTSWAPASSSSRRTQTIGTKTYKSRTKPSVRKARETTQQPGDMGGRRRRVRPDQRVAYKKDAPQFSRDQRQKSDGAQRRRGKGNAATLTLQGRGRGARGTGKEGSITYGHFKGAASIPRPDINVSGAKYDQSQNPFGVTGSNGHRR